MEAPRRYIVLAFLPIGLALVTLAALYYYRQGEEARRATRQKPQLVLDALGVGPGMRVAEWWPADTFFLERLAKRVGPAGKVYAILPSPGLVESIHRILPQVEISPEPPPGLDAALALRLRATDQDLSVLEKALVLSNERLADRGRFGLIGVGSEHIRGFIRAEEAIRAAQATGFFVRNEEDFLQPQFFLVLEKPLRP